MKVLIIANNYGNSKDGIGNHAFLEYEKMKTIYQIEEIKYITGYTLGFSKIHKILSLKMTKALNKARKEIKKNDYTYVIIEYPFMEYNPLFIIAYKRLFKQCQKKNIKLVLSLHEYLRVKKLRQKVIDVLTKKVNLLFVTDKATKEVFEKRNIETYIRRVPSHISFPTFEKKYNPSSFVYFGLINSSKAFDQMILAWKEFNIEKKHSLKVITNTPVEIIYKENYNIELFIGLNETEVIPHFIEASYFIVPIIPMITFGNSTFLTASQSGCISIGTFNDELKNNSFALNINSYDKEEFVKGLKEASEMKENEFLQSSSDAKNFGKKFTIDTTVDDMMKILK